MFHQIHRQKIAYRCPVIQDRDCRVPEEGNMWWVADHRNHPYAPLVMCCRGVLVFIECSKEWSIFTPISKGVS